MLYLVSRDGIAGYAEYDGFIIRAKSRDEARSLAYQRNSDSLWLDSNLSTCKEVEQEGPAEIILEDFRAG